MSATSGLATKLTARGRRMVVAKLRTMAEVHGQQASNFAAQQDQFTGLRRLASQRRNEAAAFAAAADILEAYRGA